MDYNTPPSRKTWTFLQSKISLCQPGTCSKRGKGAELWRSAPQAVCPSWSVSSPLTWFIPLAPDNPPVNTQVLCLYNTNPTFQKTTLNDTLQSIIKASNRKNTFSRLTTPSLTTFGESSPRNGTELQGCASDRGISVLHSCSAMLSWARQGGRTGKAFLLQYDLVLAKLCFPTAWTWEEEVRNDPMRSCSPEPSLVLH